MKYHESSHITSTTRKRSACRSLGFPGEFVGPEGEEQGVSRWQSCQHPSTRRGRGGTVAAQTSQITLNYIVSMEPMETNLVNSCFWEQLEMSAEYMGVGQVWFIKYSHAGQIRELGDSLWLALRLSNSAWAKLQISIPMIQIHVWQVGEVHSLDMRWFRRFSRFEMASFHSYVKVPGSNLVAQILLSCISCHVIFISFYLYLPAGHICTLKFS